MQDKAKSKDEFSPFAYAKSNEKEVFPQKQLNSDDADCFIVG